MRIIATHIALNIQSHRLLNPSILLFLTSFLSSVPSVFAVLHERSSTIPLHFWRPNRTSDPNREPTTTTPSNIDNVHSNHRALLRLQVRLPPPLDRSLSLSSTAWPWVSELLIVKPESTLLTKVVLMWFSVQEKTVFVGYACDSHVRGKTAGYYPQYNPRQLGQAERLSHGSQNDD